MMRVLGRFYEEAGRHEEAKAVRQRVYLQRRNRLGPQHRETLAALQALGGEVPDPWEGDVPSGSTEPADATGEE
jgi:hypothetical protein